LTNANGNDATGPQNAGAVLPAAPPAATLTGVSTGRSEIPSKDETQAAARSNSSKPQGEDKIWASVGFKIPTAGIAKAFEAAKIPAAQAQTLVLQIEAVRQEQLPDGTWGNETPVKALVFNKIMPLPK
jgi:hypothetical protein